MAKRMGTMSKSVGSVGRISRSSSGRAGVKHFHESVLTAGCCGFNAFIVLHDKLHHKDTHDSMVLTFDRHRSALLGEGRVRGGEESGSVALCCVVLRCVVLCCVTVVSRCVCHALMLLLFVGWVLFRNLSAHGFYGTTTRPKRIAPRGNLIQ